MTEAKHTPGPWFYTVRHMKGSIHCEIALSPDGSGYREGTPITDQEYLRLSGICREEDAKVIVVSMDILDALKTSQQIIRALISGQRVVNLDEALAYNDSLIQKATS